MKDIVNRRCSHVDCSKQLSRGVAGSRTRDILLFWTYINRAVEADLTHNNLTHEGAKLRCGNTTEVPALNNE